MGNEVTFGLGAVNAPKAPALAAKSLCLSLASSSDNGKGGGAGLGSLVPPEAVGAGVVVAEVAFARESGSPGLTSRGGRSDRTAVRGARAACEAIRGASLAGCPACEGLEAGSAFGEGIAAAAAGAGRQIHRDMTKSQVPGGS